MSLHEAVQKGDIKGVETLRCERKRERWSWLDCMVLSWQVISNKEVGPSGRYRTLQDGDDLEWMLKVGACSE